MPVSVKLKLSWVPLMTLGLLSLDVAGFVLFGALIFVMDHSAGRTTFTGSAAVAAVFKSGLVGPLGLYLESKEPLRKLSLLLKSEPSPIFCLFIGV